MIRKLFFTISLLLGIGFHGAALAEDCSGNLHQHHPNGAHVCFNLAAPIDLPITEQPPATSTGGCGNSAACNGWIVDALVLLGSIKLPETGVEQPTLPVVGEGVVTSTQGFVGKELSAARELVQGSMGRDL